MNQIKGAQSISFEVSPYIMSSGSVVGSKESEGPLGKLFDVSNQDDLFGAKTWEEAESNMQKEATSRTSSSLLPRAMTKKSLRNSGKTAILRL